MRDELTYLIPDSLNCEVGDEVQVEIRNRIERAWVIETTNDHNITQKTPLSKNELQSSLFSSEQIQEKIKLKPILDTHPAFNPDDLPFIKWISDYYGAPLYDVFENAVPKKIELAPKKLVELNSSLTINHDELLNSLKKKAPKQFELLSLVINSKQSLETEEISNKGLYTALKALEKKKILQTILKTNQHEEELASNQIHPPLNQEQTNAFSRISEVALAKEFKPIVLFGVTGSGKTEVYIESIRSVIKDGGNALLIVPEIALTPQIVQRFKNRLGISVSILHSRVGTASRWQAWKMILDGKVSLTIGARSAIFAPIKNLSLIIVDEEHEGSFKQSDGLRYHARDLALMKGKLNSCPVVLGSATPSFETLYHISKGNYEMLELKERALKSKIPEISIIDLNDIKKSDMPSENISPQLFEEMSKTLEKGEQIILFYNKRGFSSFLQCKTCGHVLSCPHCSVTMTYYKNKERVSCHYCGENSKAPTLCPRCHDKNVVLIENESTSKRAKKIGLLEGKGSGTEKIFEEVSKLFPEVKIARMDRESVTGKDSMEKILQSVHEGESKILIGTQMIAKGHDLPNVTLVGFINADIGLHFPDFRASERVFQLIIQASGRAGRGTIPGKVLLQTLSKDHPTVVAAVNNRFKAFARFELEYRKQLEYPPYSRLARIIISSTNKEDAHSAAFRVSNYIKSLKNNSENYADNNSSNWKILGPSLAPIEKLRARYRWHILIKSPSPKILSQLASHLNKWKFEQKDIKDFRLIVDIDPVDML